MPMLKIGSYIAAAFIGAVAAFLGVIVIIGAVKSGTIQMVYGTGSEMVTETVTRAADETRYWQLVGLLGALPLAMGGLLLRWGLRGMKR